MLITYGFIRISNQGKNLNAETKNRIRIGSVKMNLGIVTK